jgi:class 3 adenylate cyclase
LWRESCDLALEFMLDRSLVARPTSMLATVLFTDLVASTSQARDAGDGAWRETVDSHNRIGRELVREAEGVYVKSTGDGLLAYFSTPSAAILCARRLAAALGTIGLQMRAGLHTGEISRHADGDLSGIAVNVAARVMSVASDGEVWISSTVRDLLTGADVELQDRSEYDLKGIDRRWQLFSCSW